MEVLITTSAFKSFWNRGDPLKRVLRGRTFSRLFQIHRNKGLSWLKVAPQIEPHRAPKKKKSPTRLSWILHDRDKNRPAKTRLQAAQNWTGLSSPFGPGIVDSPVNRLFNPLKLNKEGVDKCFLMEFVHVIGRSVHTHSGASGTQGRGEGLAEDQASLPSWGCGQQSRQNFWWDRRNGAGVPEARSGCAGDQDVWDSCSNACHGLEWRLWLISIWCCGKFGGWSWRWSSFSPAPLVFTYSVLRWGQG